jgi:diguanylate cyclase (GGDEF)-like protein
MNSIRRRLPDDLLGVIAMLSLPAFVVILWFVAARDPGARPLLGVVITGLGAAGLIVLRQQRKAARSLTASQARAEYAATHDPKTQLPNKALFLRRLEEAGQAIGAAADHDTAYGLLCIGLDRFEALTELLGFAAADDLAAEFAARLIPLCQGGDTVARLGDDRFGLLWPSASRGAAEAMAGRVLKLLSTPCEAAAGLAHVTCSVGVAFLTRDLERPAEALRRAQMALSAARKLGGGEFTLFDPAIDRAVQRRNGLEVDLRLALARNEMTMVYQPQVDAKGAVHGLEALMRWTHAERGVISPEVFVPLAESCGLSDTLGRFALAQAFEDSRRWSDIRVAVNVSAQQVRSGKLVGALKDLLAGAGASARNIELEITEGVLLADEPQTHETLSALRRMGFSLALDDFGTGYSSLSYLRRFPIDKIKIDRSFVAHLGKRPESTAIIAAIVDLAEALELKVLAEGVETRDQVDRLLAIGCVNFQGFFYSPAVTAEAVGEMITGRATLAA